MEFIKDGILTFNYEKRDVTVTERKRPVRKPTSTVTSSNTAAMDPYDEQHINEDDFTGTFLRLCFSRCLSVHRGVACLSGWWDRPPPVYPPSTPPEHTPYPHTRPMQRTVLILVECILVVRKVYIQCINLVSIPWFVCNVFGFMSEKPTK